jgi:hypothetical protein
MASDAHLGNACGHAASDKFRAAFQLTHSGLLASFR